jgi:hypothetical protein
MDTTADRGGAAPLRIELSPTSRVLVDLRATGLLRAIGHSPTLSVVCPPVTIDVGENPPIDVAIDLPFDAAAIQPPTDISDSDRERMLENLRSPEVLDLSRYPRLDFRGRYAGTLERGVLAGDLHVRGAPHRISLDVTISPDSETLRMRGTWQGRLTDLGIKPFRALLGALKLDDWIRLRLDAAWR